MALTLQVNGKARSVQADAETPLLYALRNDLGLVGSRYGCGSGLCGACMVIVDGKAVQSCDVPVSAVVGKQITTVEALGSNDALHPLQQAFIDEHANPDPDDAAIRGALEGNLCRCGTHGRILRAIRNAAKTMRGI